MINTVNKNVTCENCGENLKITMINCVNVTLNPELRKMVLSGDLFCFHCDRCQKKIHVLYPFLYHDMNNDFMIYFCPDKVNEKFRTDFLQIYPEITNTLKRVVNSLSMLKEEIFIFENELLDNVVHTIKFALTQILKKESLKSIEGYFYGLSRTKKDLKFIFFSDGEILYKKVRFDVYNELYKSNINRFDRSKFVEIDRVF